MCLAWSPMRSAWFPDQARPYLGHDTVTNAGLALWQQHTTTLLGRAGRRCPDIPAHRARWNAFRLTRSRRCSCKQGARLTKWPRGLATLPTCAVVTTWSSSPGIGTTKRSICRRPIEPRLLGDRDSNSVVAMGHQSNRPGLWELCSALDGASAPRDVRTSRCRRPSSRASRRRCGGRPGRAVDKARARSACRRTSATPPRPWPRRARRACRRPNCRSSTGLPRRPRCTPSRTPCATAPSRAPPTRAARGESTCTPCQGIAKPLAMRVALTSCSCSIFCRETGAGYGAGLDCGQRLH